MKLPYRASCFCFAAFAVSLASADQTYAGTASSIVADLVRDRQLPEGASVSPALADIPLAIRRRDGISADYAKEIARALEAEWTSAHVLRPDAPRRAESMAREVRLFAEVAEAKMKDWNTRGFSVGTGSDRDARAQLLANLAAAREAGWKEAPTLALSSAVSALTRSLGGEFLASLRTDRSTYLGTRTSGITLPIPSRSQSIVRTYLQVQRDPQVQTALTEAYGSARGWFGPSEITPNDPAESVLLVLSRSPTGFIVQGSAYAKDGTLVDQGSVVLEVPAPRRFGLGEETAKAWRKVPFSWTPKTSARMTALSPDEPPSIAPSVAAKALEGDPLIDVAREVADAIPWESDAEFVTVLPADTWLLPAIRIPETTTIGDALDALGKSDGLEVTREGKTLAISPALRRHVDRDRCERTAWRRHLAASLSTKREDLRSYLTIENETIGRRSASYLTCLRRGLGRAGVAMLDVQSPSAVNRWLARLTPSEYATLFREPSLLGRFSPAPDPIQSSLDAWAPFTLRGQDATKPQLYHRVCLWPENQVRRGVGMRLESEETRVYSRAESPEPRTAVEAKDFVASVRASNPNSPATVQVREAARESVVLVMTLGPGATLRIPVAARTAWRGESAPLSSFSDLAQALREGK